jgi:hypothetical protein
MLCSEMMENKVELQLRRTQSEIAIFVTSPHSGLQQLQISLRVQLVSPSCIKLKFLTMSRAHFLKQQVIFLQVLHQLQLIHREITYSLQVVHKLKLNILSCRQLQRLVAPLFYLTICKWTMVQETLQIFME